MNTSPGVSRIEETGLKAERWARVREIFEDALSQNGEARRAYLADVCADDSELRREVESLLAQHTADGFLEDPAWIAAAFGAETTSAPFRPGDQLGPYRIESIVGVGGMSRVYKALDVRLLRPVAIKVLTEHLGRLTREAQAISSLNHPHICALYDVGPNYLVMEFVEGETLQARLRKTPLTLDLALRFGVQIAEALAAAHAKGVVHRDLKPANVMLTGTGVKVLDFGLARLISHARTGAGDLDSMETAPGVVLGTPAYMSPEQALGQTADHRADVFGFGCVLYEMIAGQPAFHGRNSIETMHAVLNGEPPDLELPADPQAADLERVVRHCLEKDPENRFQSARDLAFALDSISKTSSKAARVVQSRPAAASRRKTRLRLAQIAVALAALLGIAYFAGNHIAQRPQPVSHRLTFRRGWVPAARFSPDGRTVVYSGLWEGQPSDIFTVRPESPESFDRGLSGTTLLSVSRSGELAVLRNPHGTFVLEGTLARVPLSGGAPRDIIENIQGADWSPDGRDLAVIRHTGQGTQLEFPPGKVLFRTQGWISTPRFSPRGDRIAFIEHPVVSDDGGYLAVVTTAGNYRRLSGPWTAIWGDAWMRKTGEIWYTAARSGNKRDLRAVSLTGHERVVSTQTASLQLMDISEDGRALVTIDDWRTRLFFSAPSFRTARELSWLDWSGITDISPNGQRLVFFETGEGAGSVSASYMRETDGSPAVKLGNADWPRLSPDGASVAAVQADLARGEILIFPVGAGPVRHLTAPGLTFTRVSWVPERNDLLAIGSKRGHSLALYSIGSAGRAPQPVTPEGITTAQPIVSPDGRRVTVIDANERVLIYPIDGGPPEICYGIESGEKPIQWSQDGESLFVAGPNNSAIRIFRVNLRTHRRTLWKEITADDRAGVAGFNGLSVTPDGKYFGYSTLQMLSQLQQIDYLR